MALYRNQHRLFDLAAFGEALRIGPKDMGEYFLRMSQVTELCAKFWVSQGSTGKINSLFEHGDPINGGADLRQEKKGRCAQERMRIAFQQLHYLVDIEILWLPLVESKGCEVMIEVKKCQALVVAKCRSVG